MNHIFMISRLAGSRQSFQKGTNDKKRWPPIPVISTEAGQPPIGKPLIVQARGQLRLTWRLYAESPQSGEIYFLQWYMKHGEGRSLDSEYHQSVFPLSPIAACSPARDDGGGERPSRHFDHSVAEWRNLLSPMVHEAWRPKISRLRVPLEPCIPAHAPLQMTRGSP